MIKNKEINKNKIVLLNKKLKTKLTFGVVFFTVGSDIQISNTLSPRHTNVLPRIRL